MNTNTQTPRTDAAEQRDITGLGVVPVDFARLLECDLARVTAELDGLNQQLADAIVTLDGQRNNFRAVHNQDASELASLRARVAELVAALESIAAGDGDERRRAEDAIARAESATPAKRSPQTDAEAMIAACIPGGSICDPQQVADAIREYLRHQEPCGGRCGDPECDLDTNGVTMRAPAPHADTVRLDWLDEVNQQINRQHCTMYGYRCDVNHNRAEVSLNDSRIPALTVREAIDVARHRAKQEVQT